MQMSINDKNLFFLSFFFSLACSRNTRLYLLPASLRRFDWTIPSTTSNRNLRCTHVHHCRIADLRIYLPFFLLRRYIHRLRRFDWTIPAPQPHPSTPLPPLTIFSSDLHESQDRFSGLSNPEFRINPEYSHACVE